MTISKQFRQVERKFVVTIVTLATISVLVFGFIVYEANSVRYNDQVSSSELSSLVSDNSAVTEYLEQEKDFEAHFITLANLVKQEQQDSLARSLLLMAIPIALIVGLIGYLVARYLLRPVRESYESQERFMQDAAHELRNPLAAISVALQNTTENKTNSALVTTLKRQTRRLVNIVEDMLFLEKRNPGDKIVEADISSLLEDVLEDLQPSINAKSLKLKSDISSGIIMKIDPQDFVKLSRNIIENAIKYSQNNKAINVSLYKTNRIYFVVEDKGIGIPKNELNQIGERFYRAKNASKIAGTGLGLAIVNKVLNAYGGKITIKSKLNKGTTVTITL